MTTPTPKFYWTCCGASFRAQMPDGVTLSVNPEQFSRGHLKAKRGTKWNAQVSQWNEATRTSRRFGRDEYMIKHESARDAMISAERIYLDAIQPKD